MSCSTSGGQGSKNEKQGNLKWWQLSLVGVGCTIGTGYFLGSSIGITITGPSIVFSFLLAAIGTYAVFNLLAKMTAKDPQEGSFCYYAGKAFGRWARFSCGWNYWWSTTLIMGSQLIALSILSQFWFPNVPLWVFAGGYAILSILVVLMGTKSFDKVEDILAVIKTAAIIMFILLGAAALLGWIPGGPDQKTGFPNTRDELFPEGFSGFWASLIYAFYAFGGIEVIGLMAIRLKNKEDAPKSGTIMLLLLTVIYVLSLGLAVTMVSVDAIDPNESPFVTALADYKLAFFPHVFNAAIIIAGFSTLTAALFGVTTLLVTIAKDGDAPSIFAKKLKNFKELPLPSLGLGAIGLMASVITALLLPDKTYEYITTAAGILLLYNWTFIILSSFRILKETKMFAKIVSIVGLILILAAISGTLVEKSIRPGLFISLLLTAIIAGVTFIMSRKWKKS